MEHYIKNSGKNIYWINAVKAICIIFVFLNHIEYYYGIIIGKSIDGFYQTFFVNGFFFVSGYLLFKKQLTSPIIDEHKLLYIRNGGGYKLCMNIIFRIIIPSILFATIEFLPSSLIQGREISLESALYKTIGGRTYWFTSALAVAELILLLLFCTRKRNLWFYVASSTAIGIMGLMIVKNGLLENGFWYWRQGLIALIFIAIGGVYWRYEKQIDNCTKGWLVILVMIVFMILVLGFRGYNDSLINSLSIQPLGFLTSTMACLLLVWMFKKLPEWKPLSFIGKNSLGFYFLSGALPATLSKMMHLFVQGSFVWVVFVIWFFCVIGAFFVVMIINKWTPWIWDMRSVIEPHRHKDNNNE